MSHFTPRYHFDDPVEEILANHTRVLVDGSGNSAPLFFQWLDTAISQLESYVSGGGYLWLNCAHSPSTVDAVDLGFTVTLHSNGMQQIVSDCVPDLGGTWTGRSDVVFTYPSNVTCEYYGNPVAYGYLTYQGFLPTDPLVVNRYNWQQIFLLRVQYGAGEVSEIVLPHKR